MCSQGTNLFWRFSATRVDITPPWSTPFRLNLINDLTCHILFWQVAKCLICKTLESLYAHSSRSSAGACLALWNCILTVSVSLLWFFHGLYELTMADFFVSSYSSKQKRAAILSLTNISVQVSHTPACKPCISANISILPRNDTQSFPLSESSYFKRFQGDCIGYSM